MEEKKKLPIEIEFFNHFKTDNYYYVDKGQCKSFYKTAPFREKPEYRHAEIFF